MKLRVSVGSFVLGLVLLLLQGFVLRWNDLPGYLLTCAAIFLLLFGGFFFCKHSPRLRKLLSALADIFPFLPFH